MSSYGVVERGDVREGGHEMDALVDFVTEDDEVFFDAEGSDGQQLFFGEDLAKRVLSVRED